jgi:polyisoprenoid-binding protein YceI
MRRFSIMTTIAVPTATTTWTIDPSHSHVAFAVKHLMISTVRGQFSDVTGSATWNTDQPARSRVEVRIGTASIDTRELQRDAHLRSADFFDADRFPTLTFVSRRVEGDLSGQFTLVGDLTIRDVTREIVLKGAAEGLTTDPWGGERAGFSATGTINRRDFGLTWNQALEAGGVLVGDEVKLSIDVELLKQNA